MKTINFLVFLLLFVVFGIGCATYLISKENVCERVAVYIPRELFFTGGSESFFLEVLKNLGGVVDELAEDTEMFWRNYPENAGTVNIKVMFSHSDLIAAGLAMENELQAYLESIVFGFDSISRFEKEIREAYTRFVFIVDFEEFRKDARITRLLDFVFPYLGQVEYLRRVLYLYNMANLEKIVFYLEDNETLERIEMYNFLHDAPRGLSMRHNVQ